MGRHSLSVLVPALFLALLAPCPALAQYMYLDSNGDGIHTAADVLHGNGTTNVDVWLDSNHRRDGSDALCATEAVPITVGGTFVVVFRATGGTFACTNPVSLQPAISNLYHVGGTDTEFAVGYYGGSNIGAGRFPLVRLSIAATGGAPSVSIIAIASTPLWGTFEVPYTEFGSGCPAAQFDNTMRLGEDWFDVDGLAFSSGGVVNAPVISGVGDMSAATGVLSSRDIAVSDPDGDPVSLGLTSGPPFLALTVLATAPGSLAARLQAHPLRGNEGEYDATLSASDGQNPVEATFHLTVSTASNHLPVADIPRRVNVVAATVSRTMLTASDSDGDPIYFSKLSGPAYAEVVTLKAGHGGGTGALILRPTVCDLGASSLSIQVGDGFGNSTYEVAVQVLSPVPVTTGPSSIASSNSVWDVAVGDIDEDGHVDAATVGFGSSALQIFRGDGAGNMTPTSVLLPGTSSLAVALGDWNHDGHLDAAVGSLGVQTLRILYGHGNGTFENPVEIPNLPQSYQLMTRDLNGDGVDDLVACGDLDHVGVMLGHAGTGLAFLQSLPMPASANMFIADMNQDGNLDLVVSVRDPAGVRVCFGRGDGTFGDIRSTGPRQLMALTGGDWNADGAWDVVGSPFASFELFVGQGDGAGNLAFTQSSIAYDPLFGMGTADWNADGNADLLLTSESGAGLALGRGDGTFSIVFLGTSIQYKVQVADLNEDGRPDAVGASEQLKIVLNQTSAPTGVLARAFPTNAKVVPVVPSSRLLDLRVEPVGGTFTAADIDPASIRLLSEGTGSISSIGAALDKGTTIGDTDHNGVPEMTASFRMDDVAQLFDAVHGRMDAAVTIQASLLDARRLCAPFTMAISVNGTGSLAARVEPNPLNPQGALKFSVRKAGPVSVRLFDVKGRLVKTLWDRRNTQPGDQELAIDGRLPSGQPMSTGVYFYRIETDGASTSGRFAVLK